MEDTDSRITQAALETRHLRRGRVRIAALSSLVSSVLSKALKKFRSLYPDIRVTIREGTPDELYKAVEEHAVDFAVTCSPFGKFDRIVLQKDTVIAALPKGARPYESVSLFSPPDLLIVNRPALETILDFMPQKGGLKEDTFLLVENAETALRLVADGNGIGILSEYTLDTLSAGEFVKCRAEPAFSFEIGLLATDFSDLSPAAAEFATVLRSSFTSCKRRKTT